MEPLFFNDLDSRSDTNNANNTSSQERSCNTAVVPLILETDKTGLSLLLYRKTSINHGQENVSASSVQVFDKRSS